MPPAVVLEPPDAESLVFARLAVLAEDHGMPPSFWFDLAEIGQDGSLSLGGDLHQGALEDIDEVNVRVLINYEVEREVTKEWRAHCKQK